MGNMTKIERFQYVQSMLRELRDLTAGGRDELLTYLIEMAYLEASDKVRNEYTKEPEGVSRAA